MNTLNLEPGKQLTPGEKAALAKDNERESRETLQKARTQQETDIKAGQRPVVAEVADSIKEKLQKGQFNKK